MFIGQINAQNLVLNGDFETWEDASTPSEYYKAENASQESVEVHSGSYSVMHVGGTKDIAQAIGGIEAGAEYTISFWYKVAVEGDGSDVRIWSYWLDGSSTIPDNADELRGPNNAYLANSTDWTQYEATITAPVTADSFRFELRVYSGATVYWDDLSLVKSGDAPVEAPMLPYVQDFAEDLGDFDTTTVVGSQGWNASSYGDATYAKMSGYSGGSNENEDYLISPSFDFSENEDVEMVFSEAINFISSYDDLLLLVSTDYTGDIETASFDTLDITNRASGDSYDFMMVDPIDLSMYDGLPSVTIVFAYMSSTEASSTWQISDLMIYEGTPVSETPMLPYVQDFAEDLGDFDTTTVVGSQGWNASSYGDATYAKMSGYSGGSNENEDYLISPSFDFSENEDVEMVFSEAINFISSYDDLLLLVSTDYTGDIETASFDTLDITNRASGDSYDFMMVDPIDLSMYDGLPSVTIVFAYMSSTEASSTWQISDLMIYEGTPVSETPMLPYVQDFAEDLGDFDTTTVVGSQGWNASSYGDATYAKMSGYSGGSNENEDYLISPSFDFSENEDVEMVFSEAINFISSYDDLLLLVSTDYTGDIETASFDTLDITNRASGDSYDFMMVDPIDLSIYDGLPSVTIVFAYMSSTEASSTWQISDLMIYEGTPVSETPMLPYMQDFAEGFDDFDTTNVVGSQSWYQDSFGDAAYAKMSGYSGEPFANVDYLISPTFDLSDYENVGMTFSEAINYITSHDDLNVLVSTDYMGDISTANFDTLEVTGRAAGDDWSFVTVDTIDLAAYESEEMVTFFFAYESSTDGAATWEITDISIFGMDTSVVAPSNHVTEFTASVDSTSEKSVELAWMLNDGEIVADGYMITGVSNDDLVEIENGIFYEEDLDLTNGIGLVYVDHDSTDYIFENCQPGTEYDFTIYPFVVIGDKITYKVMDAPMVTIATISSIDAPMILAEEGSYVDSVVVEITQAEGLSIYYTIDGSIPSSESMLYTEPFTVTESLTVNAVAIDEGSESAISTVDYEIIVPVEVEKLADLRQGATDGTVYRLTGNAIVTMALEYRNQKYIQDSTAAIMIYDVDGIIPNDYAIGDGITSVTGTLTDYNGLLELIPMADAASSVVDFEILPQELSVTEFNESFEDYESELVTLTNVEMNATGPFENGKNYDLFDDADSTILRTHFFGMDYIGTDIATEKMLNVTGIAICYYETTQLVPRMADDIEIIISAQQVESNASIYSYDNVIHINKIADSKTDINIYAMDGRLVKSMRSSKASEQIQIFNKGIYIVSLRESSGRTKHQRVVIR